MNKGRTILRFASAGLALLIVIALLIGFAIAVGMFSHHSLTVDILGSYFPAWMICIVSGLTLTLIAHWIVQACKLKPYVGPAPLIYPCLILIFTFTTWILFYQN